MTPADEHVEPLRPNAPVFAVAPVTSRHHRSRGVLAALVLGVIAFAVGIAVASSGPAQDPGSGTAPPASGAAVGLLGAVDGPSPPRPEPTDDLEAAAPTPRPSLRPPGSSAFLAGFRPADVIGAVAGGEACVAGDPMQKEVPRTRADGPRLTFQRSWLVWCPVPGERRQEFLLDVFERLVMEVPADTFGFSASGSGAGDALFPYAERPLAGTVSLRADAAGEGYAIAIIVEEWRLDAAP